MLKVHEECGEALMAIREYVEPKLWPANILIVIIPDYVASTLKERKNVPVKSYLVSREMRSLLEVVLKKEYSANVSVLFGGFIS